MEHLGVMQRAFGERFTLSKKISAGKTQHSYVTKLQRRRQVPLNSGRLLDACRKVCNACKMHY